MIHVLTVHHYSVSPEDAKRIRRLQFGFLQENAPNCRIWACVEQGAPEKEVAEIKERSYWVFDYSPVEFPEDHKNYAVDEEGKYAGPSVHPNDMHGLRYDFLVREVKKESAPEDILIFLDSDAWPVRKTFSKDLKAILRNFKFCFVKDAVENIPHACFFATTVKEWGRINGNWDVGPILCKVSKIEGPRLRGKEEAGSPVIGKRVELHEMGASLSKLLKGKEAKFSCPLSAVSQPFNEDYYCVWGENEKVPLVYHHGGGSRGDVAIPRRHSAHLYGWHSGFNHIRGKNRRMWKGRFISLKNKVLVELEKNGMQKWGAK